MCRTAGLSSAHKSRALQVLRRPLHFALVDEVDSLLIDNCRNPMLISAPALEHPDRRPIANKVRPEKGLYFCRKWAPGTWNSM